MNNSRSKTRSDDATNSLIWAKRFLLIAALVQLPVLLPILLQIYLSQRFWVFTDVVSAVFGIIGFLITNHQLDLRREALESSPTGHLIGPRLKAGLILFFVGAFLVPLLNLVIIIWAYARANSAIQALDRLHQDAIAKREQRAKLTGGPCEAFRNVP